MQSFIQRAGRGVAAALFLFIFYLPAHAEAPRCELDRQIVFGGLDWDSDSFHNEVARFNP